MATKRIAEYMFGSGGLYSSRAAPSLLLYSSQDKEQDFFRDPTSDQRFGGLKTTNE